MIVSVTMNPSVDISYPLSTLVLDDINRCDKVRKTAGGKGLNVTRVIHQMEAEVISTGLLGGVLGEFIRENLSSEGIKHDFSNIQGDTRNCIVILHDNYQQTEILEAGPTISTEELTSFEETFLTLATSSDVATLSGSLPKGVSKDYYSRLLSLLSNTDIKVILDTSGESLKSALESPVKPYAIKPNSDELQALLGEEVSADYTNLSDILSHSLFDGVPLIMVSLGKDGAFAKFDESFYRVEIPSIPVKNPVGSGDSTVAGLAIGLSKRKSIEDVLKYAMTLGMLNAMEDTTGCVDKTKFDDLFNQVNVYKL
ncbi:hexose kinase [Vagococcus teuberi]